MNPFVRKRPNPKRDEPRRVRGREKLYGKDKKARRWEIFKRSGGRCEVVTDGVRCPNEITWESMEWSHNRHGAWKDDSAKEGLAACGQCHGNYHNAGGRPCPRRPGKQMNITDAKAYWQGEKCFCGGPKGKGKSFCPDCTAKLAPQTAMDLENTDDKDVYREVLADAELEILRKDLEA